MKDKFDKIWYQMNMKEISSEEAYTQILDLFKTELIHYSELYVFIPYTEAHDDLVDNFINNKK